ncbi:MAG: diguanylate cyclase [Ignavibacteria bacterium GWF2_33_9]|nr:MAG: diguanylate cyclase [Ignavibacteria bacterium GWF2_33_9]
MADLKTNYLGLNLKNPLIAASSGLTNSVKDIKELYDNGVGAIVIKSIFEEEIIAEMNKSLNQTNRPGTIYPEIFDFFDISDMEDSVSLYLKLISNAKEAVPIPIIGSVNCVSGDEWPVFVDRIQEAGADAIELNMFILPSDMTRPKEDFEQVYFNAVEAVKKVASIPVALKISYFFSNLGQTIQKLSETGIQGLVLFNRFYSPDIDINKMQVVPSNIYSSNAELTLPLRWIGMLSPTAKCDLSASTGVHTAEDAIKMLLAGAKTVQVASSFYHNGIKQASDIISGIESWMDKKGFTTIDEFRGKLSSKGNINPAAYERSQFMKHFAGK